MNKWAELLLGLILVIMPIIIAYYTNPGQALANGFTDSIWSAAGTVFWGGLFWAIVGVGALFILLGISDLKG